MADRRTGANDRAGNRGGGVGGSRGSDVGGFTEQGRTGAVAWYRSGPVGSPVELLLLHGVSDSAECWTPWLGSFAGRGVLALDARGHGASALPEGVPAGRDTQAADAAVVLEAQAVRPGGVVAIGHSMGAGVASALAAARPDLVAAVVLEDPAPRSGGRTSGGAGGSGVRPGMPDWLRDTRALALPERIARGRADNPAWSEAELEPWARSKDQVDPRFFELRDESRGSLVETLARIRCPVLLLYADSARGGLIDQAYARECAAAAAGPLVARQIPGAGHSIRRDAPDAYRAAVDEFLGAVLGRAG